MKNEVIYYLPRMSGNTNVQYYKTILSDYLIISSCNYMKSLFDIYKLHLYIQDVNE